MTIAEKIQQQIHKLPTALQAETLDFVEYLLAKTERETERQEEDEWSNLSLTFAMRGIEQEDTPHYTTADLKVIFS